MQAIFDVNTGQVAGTTVAARLQLLATGLWIAAAAHDPKTKSAGLSHIMLPGSDPRPGDEKTRSTFNRTECLSNTTIESGSVIDDIEFCLVGAGNILRKEDNTLCRSNIQFVTAILAGKNIPVWASILGDFERKSIFWDTPGGRVSCSEGDGVSGYYGSRRMKRVIVSHPVSMSGYLRSGKSGYK